MSLFYIGAFPPKWGGVTVKNNDLYNELILRGVNVQRIDLNVIKRKKSIPELFTLARALCGRKNRFIIGISAGSRKLFVRLLYNVNRKAMHNSIMIVMGGAAARELKADPSYMRWMSEFRHIYVETYGMHELLKECGMKNVLIYPNCRKKVAGIFETEKRTERLQCVFFSLIQREKGVDTILKSAKELSNIDFTFYGAVDELYKKEFEEYIEKLPNCFYKGVFCGTDEQKYRELAQYDLLLLPTRWSTEGVPGILVEAKIAGLTCIVSNVSYNSELIQDGVNGIVLAENNSQCLTKAIQLLNKDRSMLNSQKQESRKSADYYFIESYIEGIIQDIRN